jgi:membrane-associated phospholipid phosphatase
MAGQVARVFPRGWQDFILQVGIWLGFAVAYQLARGVSDRGLAEAMDNGRSVIETQRLLHTLIEPDLQRVILHSGNWLVQSVNWTYWLSQFAVLSVALLWIYLRRNDVFVPVRNWILAANVISLIGYIAMPTAPPRMFPEDGFVDTLLISSFNHESGIVQLASNAYAAMPSVHAADALIIGFAMATLVRSRAAKLLWTLWPTWVWFSVMATGNHFWLDIAAGVGVAGVAAAMLTWLESRFGDAMTAPSRLRR